MVVTNAAPESDILRFHHVEARGPHTIARQLGIHHSMVNRVLCNAGLPRAVRAPRTTMIDAYLPFINETLERYPSLSAERLYKMEIARGYPGGPSQADACHPGRPANRSVDSLWARDPSSATRGRKRGRSVYEERLGELEQDHETYYGTPIDRGRLTSELERLDAEQQQEIPVDDPSPQPSDRSAGVARQASARRLR